MTHIHWLRLTDKSESTSHTLSGRLADHFGQNKPHTPFFGYKLAYSWDCGATMHYSPDRPDMGRLWDFSGATCENLGMEAMSIILRWGSEFMAGCSRIDLAHDFFNGEVTPEEVKDDWYAGIENGTARKRTPYYGDGAERNEFLLGARTSDAYMRCYDKGLELNLNEFKKGEYTRIEFELKGKMSNAALLEYSVMREISIGEFCSSLWLGMANNFLAAATLKKTPFQWGIMPTYLQLPKRANSTQYWLENQVKQGICNYALSLKDGDTWIADYLRYVLDSYVVERDNQK